MKKCLFLIVLVFCSLSVISQNITDYFLMLPDSVVLGLKKDSRKKMLAVNKDYPIIYDALEQLSSDGIYYAIDILDIKNGYMSLSGAIDGQWNMCYWNLKNKNIFIAVYHEGCGPLCYVESFTFYIYENNTIKQQPYSSIIPVSWNDFLAVSPEIAEKKLAEKDIPASLLFELPQQGKNIIAKWGNTGVYTDYKGIAKGTRMTLIWNDGKFTKGEFYWE